MILWAEELNSIIKEMSDKMEIMMNTAPKDENGNTIAGTKEIIAFNKCTFALFGCIEKLNDVLKEVDNED